MLAFDSFTAVNGLSLFFDSRRVTPRVARLRDVCALAAALDGRRACRTLAVPSVPIFFSSSRLASGTVLHVKIANFDTRRSARMPCWYCETNGTEFRPGGERTGESIQACDHWPSESGKAGGRRLLLGRATGFGKQPLHKGENEQDRTMGRRDKGSAGP